MKINQDEMCNVESCIFLQFIATFDHSSFFFSILHNFTLTTVLHGNVKKKLICS